MMGEGKCGKEGMMEAEREGRQLGIHSGWEKGDARKEGREGE